MARLLQGGAKIPAHENEGAKEMGAAFTCGSLQVGLGDGLGAT